MVMEQVETPVVEADPVLPQEEQTETPQLELESAAVVEEEAAADEGEAEKPLTRADLEALLSKERKEAEERASERLRRERQRQEARRAADETRTREERAEVTEILSAQFARLGLPEADPETVTPILERYTAKRSEHITQRTLADVADAFTAAAAEALGSTYDGDLSPRAEAYVQNFTPFVKQMYQQAQDALVKSGDYVAKADLPKLVKAEIERQNAEARKGKAPLQRVEGTPASSVMSWAAYSQLSDAEKLAMPEATRREIMAADRKARLGQ